MPTLPGLSLLHERNWIYFCSTYVLYAALILTLYGTSLTIYYLFFSPLRQFQGPPLARISKLWSRVGNFYGQKSQRIHSAHLKYGSVVRIGPNELSFADPRAVMEIYTSDVFVKEESFYRAKKIFHENHLMSTRDPEAHKSRRKLFSKGYSQSSMLEYEPRISEKIQYMLDHWARISLTNSVDAYAWSHWLGFDIVYHLLFDEDPGSVMNGKSPSLMPYLRAWKPTFIYKELVPALEQWGPYVPGPVGGYFRLVQEWKNIAVQIIRGCRSRGGNINSPFLRSVLQGNEDKSLGRELTDSELAEECMGGMFGGSGTTANTFVYILWACLQRPDVTDRLRQELRATFPDNWRSVPKFIDSQKLTYVQAVIDETLRLYPTIIATLPRTAKKDTIIAGVPVPAGTIVGVQNYTLHRDPVAFDQPEEFRPERWLSEGNEEAMKAAWNPFSVGSRRCIGINLAQMELSKLVAAFFLRFTHAEIDSSMTDADMVMYDNFSAAPAGGKLLIRVRE